MNSLYVLTGQEPKDQPPDFDHWKGLPDYKQEKMDVFEIVTIRFKTEEDLKKFADLIGQPNIAKQMPGRRNKKSCWYPAQDRLANTLYRYVDEDQLDEIENTGPEEDVVND